MAHFPWNHPVQKEFNNLYLKIVQKKAKRNNVALKEAVLNKYKPNTTDCLSDRSVLKDNTSKKTEIQYELPRPPLMRPPLLPLSNRPKLTATVSPTVNQPNNVMPSDDKLKAKKTSSAIETNESRLLCKFYRVSIGQQSDRVIPSPKCTQDIWRSPGALSTPVIQSDSSSHSAKHGRSQNRTLPPETGYESDSSEKSGITYRTPRGKKVVKSTKQQVPSLKLSCKSELKKADSSDRELKLDEKCSQETKTSCEPWKLGHTDHKECCPEEDNGVMCNRASEKASGLIFNKTLEKVKAITCNRTLDKEKALMFKRTLNKEKSYNKPSKTDGTLIDKRSLRGDNAVILNEVSRQGKISTCKKSERQKVHIVKKISQKNKAAIFKKLSGKDKSFMCSKDSGQEKATASRNRSEEENLVTLKETSWKDKAVIYNKTLKKDVIHRESSNGAEDVLFDSESGKDNKKKNSRTPCQQTTTTEWSSGSTRNLDKSGTVVREDKVRPFKRKMDNQTKLTNKRTKQKCFQSSLKTDECSKVDLPQSSKDTGKQHSGKSDVQHSLSVNGCPEVDSFTALENLENKLGHKKPIEDMFTEPQLIGRQTCASRGLQYLSLASSHVGGIWRTIYSET